jgi:short-subunit dehydrogenase
MPDSNYLSNQQRSLYKRYGPYALVTGASSGIGRAFAEHLARQGFNLVLVARRTEILSALAASLSDAHGVNCVVVTADLSQPSAASEVYAAARGLDIGLLVAAAGLGTSGPFLKSDLDAEKHMLAVNCTSVLSLVHHFAQVFAARGGGGIILLSSIVAFQGVARAAHYAANKAFVQTFAEGISKELKPLGVEVIAVAPGPVASEFAERAGMQMGATTPAEDIPTSTLAALSHQTTVRPGWLSKLLGYSLATLPRPGRTIVMSKIMAGMTKQHHEPDKH